MTIKKKLLYQVSEGLGDEDWYYLAHDAGNGRIFVMHDWSRTHGDGFAPGSEDLELHVFLAETGPAQDKLRALIATLADGD